MDFHSLVILVVFLLLIYTPFFWRRNVTRRNILLTTKIGGLIVTFTSLVMVAAMQAESVPAMTNIPPKWTLLSVMAIGLLILCLGLIPRPYSRRR